MPTGNPATTRKSGTVQRNNPNRPQRPRCVSPSPKERTFFSKEPHPPHDAADGVSTYLALTFGTLLSSQGTEAAIGDRFRPLRAFPSLCSDFSRSYSVGITSPVPSAVFPQISSRRLCPLT